MARGLRLARTWLIGIILPEVTGPVYAPLVSGAQARAREIGYSIVLTSPTEGSAQDYAQLLIRGRVDGLLVASATLGDEVVRKLSEGSAPVVLVNRRVDGVEICAVVDDAAGARLATQHLLDLGHRRVGHVAGPSGLDTSVRRLHGFRMAMEAAKGAEPVVVTAASWQPEAGYEAGMLLLRKSAGITAVFAANATLALGFMRAAHELGRKIPDQLSVISLHEFPFAAYTQPPLTTVAMPLEELGSAAIDLLLARIEGRPARSVMIETPPRLILRSSTAPAPTIGRTSSRR
jgi:LacI family transcriptional regulator